VFHHAVIALAGPVLDRALTPTTFACREGMGKHAAAWQVQRQLRRFPWYVKIDIRHYFDEIDHAMLHGLLQRRFKGRAFLALLRRIIGSYHVTPGKGLPIGSLTSQHFANYYLDGMDRYILERLRVSAQVRYMDDIVWWCESRECVRETLRQVREYARDVRLLTVKDNTQINRSARGVTFCGFRITPGKLRLSRRRRRRYQERRRYWERAYLEGRIDAMTLQRAYDAVHAITLPAQAIGWRRENLARFPALDVWSSGRLHFSLGDCRRGLEARAARRQLDQQRQERALREPQRQRSCQPQPQHRLPACPSLRIDRTVTLDQTAILSPRVVFSGLKASGPAVC
jgi:hypothetical protein